MPARHEPRRIEELGLNSSTPPGQLLYDGWLLRLLPGKAKRARSVNAVYPSTQALPEKVAYCERLYRSHDLPILFRITPFSQPAGLDQELERQGYVRFDDTSVETMDLGERPADAGAELLALPEWVEAVGELRNSPPLDRASHLERLQGSRLTQQALAVRHAGAVVATGLTIVEDGWAGLFDIVTDEAQRRRGFGRRIVQGLLAAAWDLGARQAYLQVSSDNPARLLYGQFGFRPCYEYWYRRHPESNP